MTTQARAAHVRPRRARLPRVDWTGTRAGPAFGRISGHGLRPGREDCPGAVPQPGRRPAVAVRSGPVGRAGWSSAVTMSLGVLAGLVAGVGLLVVITAGFALSFDAIRAVGRASHVRVDWAWLLPAAVDGAMAVGTVTAVVMRRLGHSTVYAWVVVLSNAAVSIGCNALHAWMGASLALPEVVAMGVSAVPALNLAMSVYLLVVLVDALALVSARCGDRDEAAIAPGQAAVPGQEDNRLLGPSRLAVPATTEHDAADLCVVSLPESESAADRAGGGRRGARALQQQAWRWAVVDRRPDGSFPSGEEISRAFGRSPRWGRLVKNAGMAGRLDPVGMR